jgi:hypothetical protein
MYEAFCASLPRVYIPTLIPPSWEKLPDVLKTAWRAAANVGKS